MKNLYVYSLLSLTFILTACGSANKDAKYPKSREQMEEERVGSLTGKGGLILLGNDKNQSSSIGINVNGYLWRASLDTIHFMPVISADPFGGTILTDWYSSNSSANERLKFNIYIIGTSLRSDAIRVAAFKQVKDKFGTWKDIVANPQLAKELEDKILIRARTLKVNN